jgi:hypothetical protein
MDGKGSPTLPRRALIVAAAAGTAALAAQAAEAVVPDIVAGADGDAVKLGIDNGASGATWVTTKGGIPSLGGRSTDGDGVAGHSAAPLKSGVFGSNASDAGYGVYGRNEALAVNGYLGGPGHGAWGETGMDKYSGVYGRAAKAGAFGATGMHGPSGNYGRLGTAGAGAEGHGKTGDGVVGDTSAPEKAGVVGAATDATASGVHGYNTVHGTSGRLGTPDAAVVGTGPGEVTSGTIGSSAGGVEGRHKPTGNAGWLGAPFAGAVASNGQAGTAAMMGHDLAGVYAHGTATKPAVYVEGTAQFGRAGVATVPKGQISVRVSGLQWAIAEAAVATLGAYRAGVAVAAAVVDRKAGTLTITLTKKVTADTPVAWLLFAWGTPK